ncbi:MAG: leucyl aminopeptidase [Desulfobulbus sp.]
MRSGSVDVQVFSQELSAFTGPLVVCPVAEGSFCEEGLDASLVESVRFLGETGDFSGRQGQTALIYPGLLKETRLQARRVLFVGLGKPEESADAHREQLRLAGGTAAREAARLKVREMLLLLPRVPLLGADEIAESLSEGVVLGSYRFEQYKSKKKDDDPDAFEPLERLLLHGGEHAAEEVENGLACGRSAGHAVCAARDMAHQPGNYWTPIAFAEYARQLAERTASLRCTVLDQAALEELRMGGILGVSRGSSAPPCLVVLEYRTRVENPTVLLVGKGLTFDSGGVCLKPPAGMEAMKFDMCGGAAVLAAIQAVAEQELPGINVVALVPAAENMAGASALKPGDVIYHFGGMSSEVINTDAEGRLILADALAYGVATYRPEAVIDLATLTGAVIVGLGHHHTGLMSNNEQLAKRLIAAGAQAGEPLWRLPLGPEYRKQLDSSIADIRNAGTDRSAGTIIASCYLQEFIGETAWAHLDIAGTAWDGPEKSYAAKGPSGTGVRTLIACLRRWTPLAPAAQD